MIRIRKGSQTLLVSMCAYKDTFKKLGYTIINDTVLEEEKKTSSNTEEMLQEEINKNKDSEIDEYVVKSSDLNVDIIGEKIIKNSKTKRK